ncbi:hypothetical protein [Sphaerisporangium album]|uniref:hypothetical protein n=1 Tax=Sphaerisporangium album TaxID=509200 RepID=UPI0015EFE396|nr:hypothetical protein [Sphaerisporangium album]
MTLQQTLRGAADIVGSLPHARVSPVDLGLALRSAAGGDYHQAQAALEAFASYLDTKAAGSSQWVREWSKPRSRDEVAAELRAASQNRDGRVMAARTQDEIVTRIHAVGETDLFGFRTEVLAAALDFEHVREFLKDGVTETDWHQVTDRENAAREYYQFALGKIRHHRGLSAERSVLKLAEHAWLLGQDDVVAAMDEAPYPPYGAPKVRAFAQGFDLVWPGDAEMTRMAAGEPCTPGCVEGCLR